MDSNGRITLQFLGPVVVWRYNGLVQCAYRAGQRSNQETLEALWLAYPGSTVELVP